MRISRALPIATLAAVLALAAPTLAQDNTDGKTDAEAPAGAAFGPRAGKPAAGAPAEGPQIKTQKIATHGAWEVQCSEVEVPQGQKAPPKSCGMAQIAKNEKDDKLGITVIVSKVKQGDKSATFMRVVTPIGVYLPTGVPVEIDGGALPNRLQFTQCAPRVCEAMGEASAETLAKFKKGNKANFYIYVRAGAGIPMALSLDGFGAALAELDKL